MTPHEEAEAWVKKNVAEWGDDEDYSPHHHRITVGPWDVAKLAVNEEGNATLTVECRTLALVEGRLVWNGATAINAQRGEANANVEKLLEELRRHEASIPDLVPHLLEEACRDAMNLGMEPEDVLDAARRAAVRDVMEG